MSTMNLAKRLTDELSAEMVICRQIFERLPTNLLDWKPHQKSPSAGSLAVHIADMVEWIGLAATTDELDYLVTPHNDFIPQSQAELLDYFDERTNGAIAALSKLSDQKMHEFWTVRHGDRIFFSRPRIDVIRVDCLNHIIHHRGQLTVYFRLKDIVLPGVYGPNGEE
jgi:uncharacterized damage-inducible protein DinB